MRIFRWSQPGFSSLLLTRFLALTVVSILAVSYFGARTLGDRLRENAEERLREAALRVSEGVENYLELHRHAIAGLTHSLQPESGGTLSVSAAGHALEQTQRTYPGFLTMLITAADGRILVASRRRERSFTPTAAAGSAVSGREFFRRPRLTGKSYISGILQARGPGDQPAVSISAPLVDTAGRFLGVIEGSIDITRLPLRSDAAATRPLLVAQDGDGRVVFSSRSDLHRPLDQWAPYALNASAGTSPFLLADPAQRDASGAPIPLYSVRFPVPIAGWQVIAALPADAVNAEANLFYRHAASVLILVLLFAWEASRLLAGSIACPIVTLAAAMRDYQLDAPVEPAAMSARAAREITQIHREFIRLGTRLRESYDELRAAIAERDQTNAQLQELLRDLDRKVAGRTAELAESEARYRQVVENSGDIIFRTDPFGRITFHNAAFALLISGDASTDCTGRSQLDNADIACRDSVRTLAQKQIKDRTPAIYLEYAVTGTNGITRWIGQSTQLLLGNSRFPLGFQGIARDITEKKLAELAVREAEERYALAVRGSNNGIWDWDLRTGHVYYAPRWKQMFGLGLHDEILSIEDWFGRIHSEDAPGIRSTLRSYVQEGQDLFEAEHRIRHADGTWRWVLVSGAAVRGADGRAVRIAGSKTDITSGKLADPLTGLPNRLSLLEVLDSWNDRLRENSSRQFAILFLDLDRFKLVNDSLGHLKGDHLLLGVSLRLSAALQSISQTDGLVARLGGDEFVILLDTTHSAEAPVLLARAVIASMEPAFHLDGSLVFVTASIGIAHSTSIPVSSESLLRDADTAMYHAKAAGRGRYAIFDSSMHARAVARLGMETDLRRAVENQEFILYFQPQVDLRTGVLSGFEALVRWQHPRRGLVQPSDFIPVAEENGLILPLGRWVLEEGCRQLAEWDRVFPPCRDLSISINLSARQFTDPTLAAEVARVLRETGLTPNRLHLEVTESMLADDPEIARAILVQLSAMGVALEVDDFGTGYSCLGQLNQLPFDTLKIDRSFLRALDLDSDGHKMIDSIATLAGSLGINVVAEGVETAAHWSYLSLLGCQYGQGYYFSRPVDAAAALQLAEKRHLEPWPVPMSDGESLAGLLKFSEADPEPAHAAKPMY
jgi:diguanylate cyclase (GGDEF)-like protein/PAS domain S-box-containing protein